MAENAITLFCRPGGLTPSSKKKGKKKGKIPKQPQFRDPISEALGV